MAFRSVLGVVDDVIWGLGSGVGSGRVRFECDLGKPVALSLGHGLVDLAGGLWFGQGWVDGGLRSRWGRGEVW